MVAANAGSGKTTVLVERFVRHVVDDEIDPRAILAITFTRRAAGQLRERIRARLLQLGCAAEAQAMEAAWISTIDGFCLRVLSSHAVVAGLDPALDGARPGGAAAAARAGLGGGGRRRSSARPGRRRRRERRRSSTASGTARCAGSSRACTTSCAAAG